MTFIIDIDDTILYSDKKQCNVCSRINYECKEADLTELEAIKELYNNGHIIIFHTGRNWDCYELTKKQLENFGIKYHELIMGKPQGIYIDKDSFKTIKEALDNECFL